MEFEDAVFYYQTASHNHTPILKLSQETDIKNAWIDAWYMTTLHHLMCNHSTMGLHSQPQAIAIV